MNRIVGRICRSFAVGVLALGFSGAFAQTTDPAMNTFAKEQREKQAEQPLNNSPVWKEVRSGQTDSATTSTVRGRESNVLMNPGGQDWREFRNGPITWAGAALLLLVAAAIWRFYRKHGTIELHGAPTGRKIRRFSNFNRTVHWTVAISFVVLAVSGVIMLFGKHVLLPVLGYTLFSFLSRLAITLHNFIGPFVFFPGLVLMFGMFVKKNMIDASDVTWFKKGGGLASGEHVPSGFFNGGEKAWFWGGVTLLGIIVVASGFVLNFANFGQTRSTMQLANLVHAVGAVLFMAGFLGHAYMGTLGVRGALEAMKTGEVDETWAREHHETWYNDVKSGKTLEAGEKPAAVGQPQATT